MSSMPSVCPDRFAQRLLRSIAMRSGLLQHVYLAGRTDGMDHSRAELCSAAQYFDARLKELEQDYEWVRVAARAATQCGHRAGVSDRARS
jgi:outer membrane murein-binding lipoprotein Lpp